MSRPKPTILFAFLAIVIAGLGGIAVAKGGFFIAKHEGDTLHLLQIVFRMAEGEIPHLDFMTPIGIMAFWPIVVFVDSGFGVGQAILWSQIAMALILLIPTFWAAFSRFPNALAYLFGLSVMVLVLALVHGEADRLVSISMHYNRWAWAVAYIVIVLAVLPGRVVRSDTFDGVLIGLGMGFLLLCKVTYFASFAPVVLVALIMRRAWGALVVALVVGCLVLGAMTALFGIAFWQAYLSDLLTVAGSDVRAQPGAGLRTIIGAPAYLGGSLALLAGVVFLRQAGAETLGLLLLLLVPGFFYVTFQNFGNDPQWLMLLAILLLVPQPHEDVVNNMGWSMKKALSLTAMAALAFAAPSFLNLAYSPFRHASTDVSKYEPMLARSERHSDLQGRIFRSNRVDGTVALDGDGTGFEDRRDKAEREESHTEFAREVLPDCELRLGIVAWFEVIVADLEKNGFAGKKIYAADIFSSHWLFGEVVRLTNGSPWYYGGLPGIEDAEFMIIPLCPASQSVRKQVLEAVEAAEISLQEVYRGPQFILASITR